MKTAKPRRDWSGEGGNRNNWLSGLDSHDEAEAEPPSAQRQCSSPSVVEHGILLSLQTPEGSYTFWFQDQTVRRIYSRVI